MLAPPLLAAPPQAVRAEVVRAVAVGLDRRYASRLVDRTLVEPGRAPDGVQPLDLGADDPSAASIRAVLGGTRRWRRRLLTPDTLTAGLDPETDRALAELDVRGRLALVLADWLGWGAARIGRAVGVAPGRVPEMVDAARRRVGEDAEQVARHIAARAGAVPVRPAAPDRPRHTVLPLAAAGAVVVGLALFAGAASAPLPTVAGPVPDVPPLVEAAPPPPLEVPDGGLPLRAARAGTPLSWQGAELPPGVAFRWVMPAGRGFVAVGVPAAAATDGLVRPEGVWTSADGLGWDERGVDAAAIGPDHVVAAVAAGFDGTLVMVGGERHPGTPGAIVRPVAWRLAPGAAAWTRSGLRTAPVGRPVNVRWVYRELAVAAGGDGFVAFARAEVALTGRNLPAGFEHRADEGGVTLIGPGGAPVGRFGFGQLGVGDTAARRLVAAERRSQAWASPDGARWEPVPIDPEVTPAGPVFAAGRFWATTGRGALTSPDGARWTELALDGVGLHHAAGHGDGVLFATGGRLVVGAGTDGWYRLFLPAAGNALTRAHRVASGPLGTVAYGTMGSGTGEVIVPQFSVAGERARLDVDLFEGSFRVVPGDGAAGFEGRYFIPGPFRVDFAAGTFEVVDDGGGVRFRGDLADWAAAAAAAYRTPYPPNGRIGLWYSADGEAWSLQDAGHGLEARGLPLAVAVGSERVVMAAARPSRTGQDALPQVWVGTAP